MSCALDTNILLDIFLPDPEYGESSLDKLEKAYAQGALVICNIVYAELQADRLLTRDRGFYRDYFSNLKFF